MPYQTGDSYVMLRTIEFDLPEEVAAEVMGYRVEVFRSLTRENVYRVRFWSMVFYRIQARFSRGCDPDVMPNPSDEILASLEIGTDSILQGEEYRASSDDEAVRRAIDVVKTFLENET